jgi:hypothetical protein
VTNGCLVCLLTHPGGDVSTSGWYFQFFSYVKGGIKDERIENKYYDGSIVELHT